MSATLKAEEVDLSPADVEAIPSQVCKTCLLNMLIQSLMLWYKTIEAVILTCPFSLTLPQQQSPGLAEPASSQVHNTVIGDLVAPVVFSSHVGWFDGWRCPKEIRSNQLCSR